MFIPLFLTILLIVTVIPIPIFWVYGLYLAFQAHIIVGLLVLIIEPLPFVIGIANGIWHTNIAVILRDIILKLLN